MAVGLRRRIASLSDRAEFVLVTTVCFAYYIATSLAVLLLRLRTFELSTSRVLRGIATEIAILVVVACILQIRGWTWSRLTNQISWRAVLGAVPLFISYIFLYQTTGLLVVWAYPAASHVAAVQMTPTAPTTLLVPFLVINSVFEEVTVSGYVITALSKEGFALSVTASALIRFLYHLYQGPLASVAILPLGLLFAAAYWRWKNLWPLIGAHTIANFFAFAAAAHRSAI